MPGCEGLQGERWHFQTGRRHLHDVGVVDARQQVRLHLELVQCDGVARLSRGGGVGGLERVGGLGGIERGIERGGGGG